MIFSIVGTPHLTLLDAACYYSAKRRTYLRASTSKCVWVHRCNLRPKALTPVVVSGIDAMLNHWSRLEASPDAFGLVIIGTMHGLSEYGIRVLSDTTWTGNIKRSLLAAATPEPQEAAPARLFDLNEEAEKLPYHAASEIVQQIHPLMYRIRDPEDRKAMASTVWLYLNGSVNTRPMTGVGKLDGLLASTHADTLRRAASEYRAGLPLPTVLAKYTDVDEYALNFLMHNKAAKAASKAKKR